MSATQQRKGRRAERELAKRLRDKYGYTSVKVGAPMSYGTMPDIYGLSGVHIECKRYEKEALTRWLAQAERDRIERLGDGIPAVFWRKNRGRWVVCMDLTYWLELYEAAGKGDKIFESLKKTENDND